MPSTGPVFPQKCPHTSRTCVPSSSVMVGDVGRLHFLVARLRHLERRGQIRPQLKPVHAAGLIALRHFLVHDAAAGRHPLDVAGRDRAAVSETVAMFHRSREHVRDRLDAAMRMPGEARQIVLRHVVSKVVEQEERVVVGRLAEAKRTAQVHACAFQGGLGCDQLLDGSNGHDGLSIRCDSLTLRRSGHIRWVRNIASPLDQIQIFPQTQARRRFAHNDSRRQVPIRHSLIHVSEMPGARNDGSHPQPRTFEPDAFDDGSVQRHDDSEDLAL